MGRTYGSELALYKYITNIRAYLQTGMVCIRTRHIL